MSAGHSSFEYWCVEPPGSRGSVTNSVLTTGLTIHGVASRSGGGDYWSVTSMIGAPPTVGSVASVVANAVCGCEVVSVDWIRLLCVYYVACLGL